MKVYLKASQNGKWPKLMALTGDTVIGRSDNCNLRIASCAVSRKHCRIWLHKHGVYVTDLGSTNGTLVNNSILESAKRRQLRDRDQITIGPISFVLRIKATPEPSADDELLNVTRPVHVLRPEDLAETTIETDNPDLNDLVKESEISDNGDEPELATEDDFAESGHDRDVTTTTAEPDTGATIVEWDESLEPGFEDGEGESHAGENSSTPAGSVLEESLCNGDFGAGLIVDGNDAIADGEADLSDAVDAENAAADRFAEAVGPSEEESENVAEVDGDDFGACLVVDVDDALDETVANGELLGTDDFVAETIDEADLFAVLDFDEDESAVAQDEDVPAAFTETDGDRIDETQSSDLEPDDTQPASANPPRRSNENVVSSVSGSVADIVGPVPETGAAVAAADVVLNGSETESAPPNVDSNVDDSDFNSGEDAVAVADSDKDDLIEVEFDELDDPHVAYANEEDDLMSALIPSESDDEFDDQQVPYAHEEDDLISAMIGSREFDDLDFDDPDDHAAIAAIVGADDGLQTQYEASDRIAEKEPEKEPEKKNRLVSLLGLLGKRKKKE